MTADPSGEMCGVEPIVPTGRRRIPVGGTIVSVSCRDGVGALRKCRKATIIAVMRSTTVKAIQPTRSRVRGRNAGSVAIVSVWLELVDVPERLSIAKARSLAE